LLAALSSSGTEEWDTDKAFLKLVEIQHNWKLMVWRLLLLMKIINADNGNGYGSSSNVLTVTTEEVESRPGSFIF
jgi:hypothetical protein